MLRLVCVLAVCSSLTAERSAGVAPQTVLSIHSSDSTHNNVLDARNTPHPLKDEALSIAFVQLHDAAVASRSHATGLSFLSDPEGGAETADADSAQTAGNTNDGAQDECDVCTYVLENKEVLQPYLCRGLQQPQQQISCVNVLMSLLWWLPNEVYWINYGCQRQTQSGWQWVRPCPPHVICSWIKSVASGNEKAYCPESTEYRKPQ